MSKLLHIYTQLLTSRWWPAFDRADLLHLVIAIWLIMKQRLALQMIDISPGSGMMAASIGAVLFLTAWVRRSTGRWQALLWMIVSLTVSLVMYADILYYRQFGDLVSVASLRFSGQLTDVGSSVTTLMRPTDLWLFADLPVLAVLLLLPAALRSHWFTPVKAWAVRATALVGAVVVALVAVNDPLLAAKYYGHSMVGSRMGLINYHAFDLGAYAGRLSNRLTPQDGPVRQVREWFAAQPEPTPGPLTGVARGKNVILLQVESLQSFPLGMKIGDQEITPNLNRLMAESLSFPNFYHQTGQGVTSDADLLANCSLYPTRTGAVYYDYAHNDFRCLPTLLREQGYTAVAMQGMPADFWNLAAVYPRVGFERYDSLRSFVDDERVGIGLSDKSFLRQATAKLKALPEPYYAFLVTLTSHGPFDFENLPKELKLDDLEGTKAANYLHAVHYTDQAIGAFIDQLKAEGILDRSLLVLYGDHQGVWRNDTGMEALLGIPHEDQVGWSRAEKRVPLMIRLPGAQASGAQSQAAGQVDIAPTIAGLIGLPTDDAFFIGRDLLATDAGVVPFYRGSAADDTHLYVSPDEGGGSAVCYAIATGETQPVEECADLAARASEQLAASRLIVERNLIPHLLR